MTVLVVAPHPDDEAIGCGGTILRLVAGGERVVVAFLTSGELALPKRPADEVKAMREQEAQAAAEVLGISDVRFLRRPDWGLAEDAEETAHVLAALLQRERPHRVYVPHEYEWHPDHRAAFAITQRVVDEAEGPRPAVLAYEVWTPLREWDVVEDISPHMQRKLDAIRCYRSQLTAFDYVQAATGLGSFRGALVARTAFAEVFETLGTEVVA